MKVIDSFDSPSSHHILKKIGDLKETLKYIKAYSDYCRKENLAGTPVDPILKILDWISEDDPVDIYFGYMNDKYWYPNVGSDEDAIKSYWFDTVVIFSEDEKFLERLYALEMEAWDKIDRGEDALAFDDAAIKQFENGRRGLWLWID